MCVVCAMCFVVQVTRAYVQLLCSCTTRDRPCYDRTDRTTEQTGQRTRSSTRARGAISVRSLVLLSSRPAAARAFCACSVLHLYMCTFCRSCLHSILFPSSSYRTARRKRRSSAAAQQVFGLHKQNHVGRHDWLEVGLCECWSSVLVFPASGSLVVCVLLPSPTPAVFPQASGLRVLLLLLSVRPHSVSLFYSPPALLLSVLRFSRACTPRFVVFRCAALLFLFAALLPSARCPLLPPRSLFFLALLTRRSSLTIPSPNLTLLIAGSIHNAYEPRSRST